MFFDSWTGLARVLIAGTFAYALLVLFLRISGKRTLTKLNAFDLVVTVALGCKRRPGSTFAVAV